MKSIQTIINSSIQVGSAIVPLLRDEFIVEIRNINLEAFADSSEAIAQHHAKQVLLEKPLADNRLTYVDMQVNATISAMRALEVQGKRLAAQKLPAHGLVRHFENCSAIRVVVREFGPGSDVVAATPRTGELPLAEDRIGAALSVLQNVLRYVRFLSAAITWQTTKDVHLVNTMLRDYGPMVYQVYKGEMTRPVWGLGQHLPLLSNHKEYIKAEKDMVTAICWTIGQREEAQRKAAEGRKVEAPKLNEELAAIILKDAGGATPSQLHDWMTQIGRKYTGSQGELVQRLCEWARAQFPAVTLADVNAAFDQSEGRIPALKMLAKRLNCDTTGSAEKLYSRLSEKFPQMPTAAEAKQALAMANASATAEYQIAATIDAQAVAAV